MTHPYLFSQYRRSRTRNTITVLALFIVMCMGLIVSCRERGTELIKKSSEYEPFYRPEDFRDGVKTVTMALGDSIKSAPPELLKNKYGQFFYGRAEYYVIESPTNKLMNSKVLRTVLSYFDSKLYKVQYIIAKDISYELINELPTFSIVTYNHESRNCLQNEPPVLRLSNRSLFLNPGITDYELRWKGEKTIVKWRCSKSRNLFEYSELDAEYANKFYELEKYEFDLESRF